MMVIHRVARPMSARRLAGPHRAVNWREQMAHDLVAEDRAPVPGHHDRDVTMLTHFYPIDDAVHAFEVADKRLENSIRVILDLTGEL